MCVLERLKNLLFNLFRFLPQTWRNINWIKKGQIQTHKEYERIIKVRMGR